jgi:5-formyltetrahydrofolate cyclo-ligase
MQKSEARKIYREKRMALSISEKTKLDDLLLIQFQKIQLPAISNVLSYFPIEENKEPDTGLFTRFLKFRYPGLQLLYPKSDFKENELMAIAINDDTEFIETRYHINEPREGKTVLPQEIDMVFVPLLAFDAAGYRVGYGKGFYDRFLSRTKKICIKAGFSYFDPLTVIDDRNQFDVPLNCCITPNSTYVF